MTPQDVTIFQVLAAAFTVSFMALTFAILRFLRDAGMARNALVAMSSSLYKGLELILMDLRAAAAQFRAAAERTRHGAEQVAELGDQVARLTSITKNGVKGAGAMLAGVARAVFKI